MLFLLNTFLGFFIAQFLDIMKRDRENNKKKFDLIYFLKDTWLKIVISLLLSMSLSSLLYVNGWDISTVFEEGDFFMTFKNMEYALIGFAPEAILQYYRNKYGFLKPNIGK
jgi:hypothetical protein